MEEGGGVSQAAQLATRTERWGEEIQPWGEGRWGNLGMFLSRVLIRVEDGEERWRGGGWRGRG